MQSNNGFYVPERSYMHLWGVGEQCSKVTLPSSAEGAESEGENESGPSQRVRSRGGESEGENQRGRSRRGRCGGGGVGGGGIGSMLFHRAQKLSISRAQPPPTGPRNVSARIKNIKQGAV
jgi:hypothetical protein